MATKRGIAKFGAWTVAGVLAAGLAGGIAYANFGAASSVPSASVAATSVPSASLAATSVPSASVAEASASAGSAIPKAIAALVARATWAEATLRTKKGFLTVEIQRGIVTGVSATSLTVTGAAGRVETYVLTSKTKVRRQGKASSIKDIAVNDRVLVLAIEENGTFVALRVRDAAPKPAASNSAA